MKREKIKATVWGVLATAALAGLIVLGSRNLAHFDAAWSAPSSCLVRKLGLAEAIDERLHLLKLHLPYHESDHVLNFA